MPVRAEALGRDLEPATVTVTPRMVLAYAAAIGDTGPRTFDDTRADLVASPAFCVRLEWTVLLGGRTGVLGLSEAERLRAVHVEQDSTFHRAIRPGDRLSTRARVVSVRSTSAGTLVQTHLVTVDAGTEAPVVTSWHSSIYREVALDGADGRVEEAPAVPAAAVALNRRLTLAIPREAAHVYTECSGIWNPIHSERRVALAAGLPDVILHGTATWAMAGREIVREHAGGEPMRLRRLRARFRAPVVPGGDIVLTRAPVAPAGVRFEVRTARGEVALEGGYAEIGD
jgi:acyl dehydratase